MPSGAFSLKLEGEYQTCPDYYIQSSDPHTLRNLIVCNPGEPLPGLTLGHRTCDSVESRASVSLLVGKHALVRRGRQSRLGGRSSVLAFGRQRP